MNEFAYKYCYYSVVEWASAPCGYFRDTRTADTFKNYLRYSWFLAKLNNENGHTSNAALDRKQRVLLLNKWLAVSFARDGIVVPKDSAIFSDL